MEHHPDVFFSSKSLTVYVLKINIKIKKNERDEKYNSLRLWPLGIVSLAYVHHGPLASS